MSGGALNYRYGPNSRALRDLGERLLGLTAGYAVMAVRRGTSISTLTELALVARARHILKAAYRIADTGDAYNATILQRSLNETGMTLAWLIVDPELATIVMRLDTIRTRLSMHRDYARVQRNERRAARRRGEPVEPLAPGASLGLLDRAAVREFGKLERSLRAEAQGLARYGKRKKRLGVKSIAHVPSFKTQAQKSKNPWMYVAAYRFDSNSAGHPTMLDLQQFIDDSGVIVIREAPEGARPDPYATSAVLLGIVAQLAVGREGHPAIDKVELDRLEAELRALWRASDHGGGFEGDGFQA